jgi:hypothetical protein
MGCSSFDATNACFSRAVRASRVERGLWRAGVCFVVLFLVDVVESAVVESAGAVLTLVELVGLAAGSAPAGLGACAVAAGTGGLAVEGELAAGVAVDCAGATAETNNNAAEAMMIANAARKAGGVKRVGEDGQCIVPLYAGLDAGDQRGESLA